MKSRYKEFHLSNEQKRIWTITEMNKDSSWTQLLYKRFKGTLDKEKLKKTLNIFLSMQEQLKSNYIIKDSEVIQIIWNDNDPDRYYKELDFTSLSDKEKSLSQYLLSSQKQTFDLRIDPLYKMILIKMDKNDYVIIQIFHHSIFDAYSIHLFWDQFTKIWEGVVETIVPYTKYIEEQQTMDFHRMKQFWKSYLSNMQGTLPELIGKKDFNEKDDHKLEVYEIDVNQDLTSQINAYSFKNKVSPLSVYMTALFLLVYKYTGIFDVCLGTFFSGRYNKTYKNTIGFFMKTLPVRYIINPEEQLKIMLTSVHKWLLEIYKNQDYPLSSILDDLLVDRASGEHPLFPIVFNRVVNKKEDDQMILGGLKQIQYQADIKNSDHSAFYNFILSMLLNESINRSILTFWYRKSNFDKADIERLANCYLTTLNLLINKDSMAIKDLCILNKREYNKLVYDWNKVECYSLPQDNLYSIFKETALNNGKRVAVVDEDKHFTYEDILQISNRYAEKIKRRMVPPKSRIAILLPRGYKQVACILAVLQADCSYVPIDINTPQSRIRYIIQDSSVCYIMTDDSTRNELDMPESACIDIDCNEQILSPTINFENVNKEAYLLYTSGSTGQPKGVAINHSNVVRLLRMANEKMQFSNTDVWTLFHSIAFDFSVWEIFGALLYGGRLVIVSEENRLSAKGFAELINNENVTILNQTPYSMKNLITFDPQSIRNVRIVLLSADKFDPVILRDWAKSINKMPRIVNAYGITETTVLVTHHDVELNEIMNSKISNIGKAYPDTKLYLLDFYRNPVPLGAVGELYVSGPGVAGKYINDRTNEVTGFYPSTFEQNEPYNIMYKTGDLCFYLESGDLIYTGRNDNQVQLRGYRIELDEIASTLREHPAIKDCVICKRDIAGQDKIIAYIVLNNKAEEKNINAYEQLKKKLPRYMIPSIFKVIDEIPITMNGKVDFSKLPYVEDYKEESVIDHHDYSYFEKILLMLWSKYLKRRINQITDNFFELGGGSIDIIMIKSELDAVYDVELPVVDFYRYTTIEEMALHIEYITDSNKLCEGGKN